MTDAILHVDDLHKSYGSVVALDGVGLSIGPGEIVGLLGPNGAGKTTLVSIVCGLRRAERGTVRVCGVDALTEPQRARRHIGLAPQELGVYPIDTVRQNLALFAELAGLKRRELAAEIEAIAAALHLEDLLDRKAGGLSGGQKRRVHTAIALLNRPSLILLDEATAGADVGTRSALIQVVRDLASRGSAVLYSTHYLGEVEALDAGVVVMDRGRVMARGSVQELVGQNGGSWIELRFEGRPPPIPGFDVISNGASVRIPTDDPGKAMAQVMGALGEASSRLHTVEVIRPSLETVFLSLTGKRYDEGPRTDEILET